MKIRQALISVSDKTGVVELGRRLAEMGVKILSTGGTAKTLAENGVAVTEVSDYTGQKEILDGRVKTLHPKIHAGLLALRNEQSHMDTMTSEGFETIDLVAINLYPFEKTVAKEGVSVEEAIENIDIGGPTMIRAAAKNWRHVAVLTDSADYEPLLDELAAEGEVCEDTLWRLMNKAFARTAQYDIAVSNWLYSHDKTAAKKEEMPERVGFAMELAQAVRYGENPHQKAAFYRESPRPDYGLANFSQLQGKELSFNNLLDLDAAVSVVKTFEPPTAVIVKHNNPCGIASAANLTEAYERALAADPQSAFGGIVALNGEITEELAKKLAGMFLEVVVAPRVSAEAAAVLSAKKNLRVLEMPKALADAKGWDVRKVAGGWLLQDKDELLFERAKLNVVSARKPTDEELESLLFGFNAVRSVKSNAIVLCRGTRTIGVGAGQMSRVDSVRISIEKARSFGFETKGAALASDGFFPFRDNVDLAAAAGVTAIIEPGGSVKDEEVIAAADEHNIALVFTGFRHFRH